MSSLSERMKAALESREGSARAGERINKAGLARACKIKASSVNDWFSGKTKSLGGENLVHAAAYLQVSANWLATGVGSMAPYTPGSSTNEPQEPVNHTGRKIATDQVKDGQSGTSQYKGVSQVVANARVTADGGFVEDWFEAGQGGWVQSLREIPSYALRIRGNALAPVYDNGKILIVEPGTPLAEEEDIVVRWKDGRNSIFRLMKQRPDSLVVLSVLGGPPQTVDLADVLEVQAVYGSVGASKWRDPAELVSTAPSAGIDADLQPDARAPVREGLIQTSTTPAKRGAK